MKKAISISPDLKNFVVEAVRGGEHFKDTSGDFCIDNFIMREQNCTDDCEQLCLCSCYIHIVFVCSW